MGPVARALIIFNGLVFFIQAGDPNALIAEFALWPAGSFAVPELGRQVGFEPWQLVTYSFLHGSLAHLALNMFGLWMFGRDVEHRLGSPRFLAMYFSAVLTAALTQLVVVSSVIGGPPTPTVGASGGVFGVLLAFGLMFPRRTVVLLIPPIPMPAWLFVTLYGAIELMSGVMGTTAGIAHFAHLGGMVGAYLVLRHRPR